MIRFNKRIQIENTQGDEWRLRTDRGDEYNAFQLARNSERNIITDWWSMQHHSLLREWQRDLFIKEISRYGYGDDFELFVLHKRGQGLNQSHDLLLVYHRLHKIWILSTQECLWFQPGYLSSTEFHIDQALSVDITLRSDRDKIYPILDHLNSQYR